MANFIVYLGAQHWRHETWHGDFYPDALPEDWQLPFYNTQFRCVYLSADEWQKASELEIAGWLQETQPGFRFVLGGMSSMDEEAMRKAECFGERGVMENRIDILWANGETDLRELAGRMQKAAQSGIALYVIANNADLSQLRKISNLMSVLGV